MIIRKTTTALIILISLFVVTPIALAASSDFLERATEFYQRYCTRRRIPITTAVSCYLYDKVSEIDQGLFELDSRLDLTEADNATQSAKIVELEGRIADLEASPEPSPSPQTLYIVSDTSWHFSLTEASGWLESGFDDSGWPNTDAPSGGQCSPGAIGLLINQNGALPMSYEPTPWSTGYFRKTFNISGTPLAGTVRVVLDDDGDLYINGNLALTDHDGHVAGIQTEDISPYLASGENVIGFKVIDSAGGCQHAQVEIAISQ